MKTKKLPRLYLFVGSWLIVGTLGCATVKTPQQSAITQMVKGVVMPAYKNWHAHNDALLKASQNYCATDTSMETLQESWRQTAEAWSSLQPLLMGPAAEQEVPVRVNYWPDKKDLVARQVKGLLATDAAITSDRIEHMSVALQGLSAFEYVLFNGEHDNPVATEKPLRCHYLQPLAERQVTLSGTTLSAWEAEEGFVDLFTEIPNKRYATEQEAMADLLKANVDGLEVVHKKIALPLGTKTPQPFQAEYWRSSLSLQSVAASLKSSQALWEKGYKPLVKPANSLIALSVDQFYASILEELKENTMPLTEHLKTEAGRKKMEALSGQLKALHILYANDVSKILGIQLGFNANDGD